MGTYTQQLQQLYIAYFKRPADVAGLAMWEQVATTKGMDAVHAAFTHSQEYRDLYASLNNEQAVNTLYQNLFGRDGEPEGLAFWRQQLDSGKLTLETLASAMIATTAADDVAALAHKTAAATAFTAALNNTAKADGYTGAAANDIARAWLATVTGSNDSATTATAAMASAVSRAVDAGHGIVHGKLVDGYISGATIFADANGNGRWDLGEARAATDAHGNFTLHNPKGTLIATGGTDLGTKLPFTGILTAPEGATVVNPLTTLQQALIRQGQSVDHAQATIAKAFGLSVATLDFDQRDPLAAAFNADASVADQRLAVQMQAAAAKIQNLLVATSQTLTGAVAGLSASAAAAAASKALAEVIGHDADGVVSLADTAVLSAVLTGAAAQAGASPQQTAAVAALASGFSSIMAGTAQHIDRIVADNASGSMGADLAQARILQVETAAQGKVAGAIHDAAVSGNITQAVSQLTGEQLNIVVISTKIGDVVPANGSDGSAIDIVNGRPEPEPVTVPVDRQAPTNLKVNDLVDYSSSYLGAKYGAMVVAGHNLVQTSGQGFGTLLGALDTDDNSIGIDVSGAFANGLKLGATTYNALSQVFVGVNGYLTFGQGSRVYAASGIAGYKTSPMIAAQFDDIFAGPGRPIGQSAGGNSTGSNHIYYDVDTVNHIVTVTWDDVAALRPSYTNIAGNDYTHGNAFQIRLHWLQNSDFLIELRYENMSWIGGNRGLPTAGWTAGDGVNYGEIQGSGTEAMLNLAKQSNVGQNGVYVWEVKNGVVSQHLMDVNDAAGKTVFSLNATDTTAGEVLSYALDQGADSRFTIVNGNQIAVAANAHFDLTHESTVTLPVVVTDKAGNALHQNMVITLFATPDTTAPTLSASSPSSGEASMAVDGNIVLTFSEAVQAGTGSITLVPDGNGSSIAIAVDSSQVVFNGHTVTINPTADLQAGVTYHVEIGHGVIEDLAHNAYAGLSGSTALSFTTATDTIAPTLASANPLDDATGVAVDSNLVLTFSEAVHAGAGSIKLVQDGGAAIDIAAASGQVVFSGNTVTINPAADLVAGANYHVEVGGDAILDAANNAFAGIANATTLNFSTAAAVDTTPPSMMAAISSIDRTNAVPTANVKVYFDEDVKAGSGNIEFYYDTGSGLHLEATVAVNSSAVSFDGHTMKIDLANELHWTPGQNYQVVAHMASGVVIDLVGNAYAGFQDQTTLHFSLS
ncbi:DUF4214 domain-containing protein [Duganella sp. CY15W]|uniref:Ig-like domain-containing protein n=1 Tax=Duganella sp. CY15W TaxID=2692172 RepID=UPI0013681671|nr:Ig-like domain-containing protein [Duganella sp. CY15W]MYM31663.1 DUF4214 domain-containing protein [Duganella sp. CY15W]